MKIGPVLFAFGFGVGVSVGLWKLGNPISFAAQVDHYKNLATAAAAVFAVMGIWIGIAYPGVLANAFKDGTLYESTTSDEERVLSMLSPIMISSVIMVISFGIPLAGTILQGFNWIDEVRLAGKLVSLTMLVSFAILQAFAVLECLIPFETYYLKIQDRIERRRWLSRGTERYASAKH